MSLKDWVNIFVNDMTTMIRILRDFQPILDLDLYGERTHEKTLTGSKTGFKLSAGSTYTRVYTVQVIYILPDYTDYL